MSTYKPGDDVRHKSGGPTMTVESEQTSNRYHCQWWNGKAFERNVFAGASLIPAVAGSPERVRDVMGRE